MVSKREEDICDNACDQWSRSMSLRPFENSSGTVSGPEDALRDTESCRGIMCSELSLRSKLFTEESALVAHGVEMAVFSSTVGLCFPMCLP